MRASTTGFAIALLTTVVAAGMASAQSSYPCTETNSNLPNPYRLVANWASPPRPWSPVNAVAVDPSNNLWAVDRCETDDCIPVIELGPDGKTLRNFGAGLFVEPHQAAIDKDGNPVDFLLTANHDMTPMPRQSVLERHPAQTSY